MHFRDSFLKEVGVDEVIQQSDIEIINKGKTIGEVASELNEFISQRISKKIITLVLLGEVTKSPQFSA